MNMASIIYQHAVGWSFKSGAIGKAISQLTTTYVNDNTPTWILRRFEKNYCSQSCLLRVYQE